MRNLDDALIRRKFFKVQVRARASLSITRQDFLPQTSIAGLATIFYPSTKVVTGKVFMGQYFAVGEEVLDMICQTADEEVLNMLVDMRLRHLFIFSCY